MTSAFAIALKDLRQRFRDRSALVLGFVAPLVIAVVMSVAFRGTEHFHTDVAVVDDDHGPVAAAFVAMLHGPGLAGVVTVKPVSGEAQARSQVRDGTLGAAFVVPAGFSAAVHGTATTAITVLGSAKASIAREICTSLAQSFTAQLGADRLSVVTALAAGAPPASAARLAGASALLRLPLSTTNDDLGARRLTATSYYAPSMGIFFVFFGIGFGARSFWLERRSGTLDRIVASPAPLGATLIGNALATLVFALASLTTMAVVTSTAFGAYWGPVPAAAALILAMALATAALTALVSAIARTDRQVDAFASIVTFALVLLGGNFVFVSQAPPLLRRLALFTPNGWAMRGFIDLQSGLSWTAAVVPVAAILGFTAAVAAVAAALAPRAVLP